MSTLSLAEVRVQDFKAIRDSGAIALSPLTVFIGANGAGKSSLIEALETLHTLVTHDLDAATQAWRGFDHIRNKVPRKRTPTGNPLDDETEEEFEPPPPIRISARGGDGPDAYDVTTTLDQIGNLLFIEDESVQAAEATYRRKRDGSVSAKGVDLKHVPSRLLPEESLLARYPAGVFRTWQFLNFAPHVMGDPVAQKRTGGPVRLRRDAANIAQYLWEIRDDPDHVEAWTSLVDALKTVLPYATDLQPALTSDELQRTVFLQMTEGDGFKVPGWLLSAGTLRVLALLAVLRHPNPPRVLFVEEVENGLDPRTIRLIVEELLRAVATGRTQVIATSHSPFLLDLVPLDSIQVVERGLGGPSFWRPADEEALKEYAEEFKPGQLYADGRLRRDPTR